MKIDGSKLILFGFFALIFIVGVAIFSGVVTKNILSDYQVKNEHTRFTITDSEEPTEEDKNPSQPDTSNESKEVENEVGTTTESEEDESEVGATTDSYELGISVYAGSCLMCHGEMGANGQAPNLQESEFAQKYDNVVDQVKNGGTFMPPFEENLSEEEIEAVARYVNEVINKADE